MITVSHFYLYLKTPFNITPLHNSHILLTYFHLLHNITTFNITPLYTCHFFLHHTLRVSIWGVFIQTLLTFCNFQSLSSRGQYRSPRSCSRRTDLYLHNWPVCFITFAIIFRMSVPATTLPFHSIWKSVMFTTSGTHFSSFRKFCGVKRLILLTEASMFSVILLSLCVKTKT